MNLNSSLTKKQALLILAGCALGLDLLSGCVVEARPRRVYVAPAPAAVVVVQDAPPAAIVEVVPPRPGYGYIWCTGHWRWNGHRYYWFRGHWEYPPRGYNAWVAPHWEVRGGGYFFVEGRWH